MITTHTNKLPTIAFPPGNVDQLGFLLNPNYGIKLDGTNVISWTSCYGDMELSQYNPARRPIFEANGVSTGVPCLHFDSTVPSCLHTNFSYNTSAPSNTSNLPVSATFVFKFDTWAASKNIITYMTYFGSNQWAEITGPLSFVTTNGTTNSFFFGGYNSLPGNTPYYPILSPGDWHVISFRMTSIAGGQNRHTENFWCRTSAIIDNDPMTWLISNSPALGNQSGSTTLGGCSNSFDFRLAEYAHFCYYMSETEFLNLHDHYVRKYLGS